jgi:hypothetical protein
LDTEVSSKEESVIAFQPGPARIGVSAGRVIDGAATPRSQLIIFGLKSGQNHETDDGPAAESRFGIVVIANLASIFSERGA